MREYRLGLNMLFEVPEDSRQLSYVGVESKKCFFGTSCDVKP
jgi:hypothetical protein